MCLCVTKRKPCLICAKIAASSLHIKRIITYLQDLVRKLSVHSIAAADTAVNSRARVAVSATLALVCVCWGGGQNDHTTQLKNQEG